MQRTHTRRVMQVLRYMNARLRSTLTCLALLNAAIVSLTMLPAVADTQTGQAADQQQLWVTMHTAPIEDY